MPLNSISLSLLDCQVTEETAEMLERGGFKLTRRGKIFVKGKGEVTTYFITEWPEKILTCSELQEANESMQTHETRDAMSSAV